MKLMSGMSLVSYTLGILVCGAALVLNLYLGNRMMVAAFLLFALVNAVGAYANYRSLKAYETSTKEEGQ